MTHYVVDTNVLLEFPNIIEEYPVVITSDIIRELENFKQDLRDRKGLKARARQVTRMIQRNRNKIFVDLADYTWDKDNNFDPNYTDNKIIIACIKNGFGLITNDILLQFKAELYDIPLVRLDTNKDNSDYNGITDVFVDENNFTDDLNVFYDQIHSKQEIHQNVFNLALNEYIVLWDINKPDHNEDGVIVGYKPYDKPYKWDGQQYVKLKFKNMRSNSSFTDNVSPINVKQECMFDMLQNKDTTVKLATGGFGVGKDFVMISHAVKMLEDPKNKIQKILWVRNNVELENSESIGFLPGDKDDKLIEYAMPLADHLGGIDGLNFMIQQGKVEIQHLGTLRGRDIKDSIIYVTEVQNNTKEHIKLLLGRVGEGTQIWLNGDLKQADKQVFKYNSGLNSLKKLAGQPLFSMVTLDKIERSQTARLAELLDD